MCSFQSFEKSELFTDSHNALEVYARLLVSMEVSELNAQSYTLFDGSLHNGNFETSMSTW